MGFVVQPDMQRAHAFSRADETADDRFYAEPRFVQHIDDAARAAVTACYRDWIPAGARVLDVMSSWVSHLPPEAAYASVTGLGMNERELRANPRLSAYVVHDLNREPHLSFPDESFDAVVLCVSIQYLTQPVAVLRELGRVATPGSRMIVTFSNRRFPTKAVAIWNALTDAGHVALVERYLADAGWADVTSSRRTPFGHGDPLFAVIGRRSE